MLATLGQWVMEQIVGGLKEQRVTVSLTIALIILAVAAGYLWADDQHGNYVTKEESARQTEELKSRINENGATAQKAVDILVEQQKLLTDHVEEFSITMANQWVKDAKTDIRLAEANSATSEREIRLLEEELKHAEAYKQCLIERRPNCKHLRDSSG